jgi:hypothetical protein
VEEQDVTVDGSSTRDPDNDPLTYRWELVSAPTGSTVTVSATTPSFVFRPDVPGDYQLRLTASDADSSDTDTMRVSADALFVVTGSAAFAIDGSSPAGSDVKTLKVKTSGRYSGAPVSFTATSSVPWLTAPAAGTLAGRGAEVPLELRLNLDELRRLENGKQEGRVTITPSGGWSGVTSGVTLDLALPRVRSVLPYVAYVNESSRITLHGEKLLKSDGQSLFVGGAEALDIEATSDTQAVIDLPPLAAGTYTVRIGDALALGRESARVVVRAKPVHTDFTSFLEAVPNSLAYDAERDVLYYTLMAPNGFLFAFSYVNDGSGTWFHGPLATNPIQFEPDTLALAADGGSLLMASGGCRIHKLDPETGAILETAQHTPCAEGSRFTSIAPLPDGRALLYLAHLNGEPEIREYPGFAAVEAVPPRRDSFFEVSGSHNRVLSVQSLASTADVYDLDAPAEQVQLAPHTGGLTPFNVSMSADGSRTLHGANVYDRDFNLQGRLVEDAPTNASVINPQGTRAVTLDGTADALYVHDVTGNGPAFPRLGPPALLGEDVDDEAWLIVPPSGGAVLMFGIQHDFIRPPPKFYVRTHPALAR